MIRTVDGEKPVDIAHILGIPKKGDEMSSFRISIVQFQADGSRNNALCKTKIVEE